MCESIESVVERAIINLEFARAEIAQCPMSVRAIQAIEHIVLAIAEMQKLAPRYDGGREKAAGCCAV